MQTAITQSVPTRADPIPAWSGIDDPRSVMKFEAELADALGEHLDQHRGEGDQRDPEAGEHGRP